MTSDRCTVWPERALYDIADYVNGRATKPSELVADGIPVIKIAELTRGITPATNRIRTGTIRDKHWVRDGDLLFAWSGTVGIHVYHEEDAALNQHIFRVVATEEMDQRFVRYLLEAQLPLFARFVESKRTTMGHVTVADLKATAVPVPPQREQVRIGELLGALDDKIDSNRRLAGLLEQTAAELFRARFVDFIGVEDFVDSVVGLIPTGWRSGPLRELAQLKYGKALKAVDRVPGPVAVVGSSGIVGTHTSSLESGPVVVVGRKGTAGSVIWVERAAWPIDTTFVAQPVDGLDPVFLYFALKHANMPHLVADSAVPGLNREAAEQRVVVIPPATAIDEFSLVARPLFRYKDSLIYEAESVRALRELLLPGLVSGAIRVPDVADSIGMVEEIASALP